MASITYTAKEKLISGHSSGTSYTMDFNLTQIDEIGRFLREEAVAMDGTTETTDIRADDRFSCQTEPVEQATFDQLREWFYSVRAGETFTFDAYGTSSSPDNPQTVRMESTEWAPRRMGTISLWMVPFEVRVVS